jgi:hypothetical protein
VILLVDSGVSIGALLGETRGGARAHARLRGRSGGARKETACASGRGRDGEAETAAEGARGEGALKGWSRGSTTVI